MRRIGQAPSTILRSLRPWERHYAVHATTIGRLLAKGSRPGASRLREDMRASTGTITQRALVLYEGLGRLASEVRPIFESRGLGSDRVSRRFLSFARDLSMDLATHRRMLAVCLYTDNVPVRSRGTLRGLMSELKETVALVERRIDAMAEAASYVGLVAATD